MRDAVIIVKPQEDVPRCSLLGKQGDSKVDSIRSSSFIADMHDWVTKALTWNTWFLMFVFVFTYVFSFFFFGCMWYALEKTDPTCLENIDDFNDAFVFSIETQATIGYGFKHLNSNCEQATILLLVQILTGYFIDAMMLSIIYSKLTQSKRRAYLLRCSRFAVITHRNGKPCLMVRVGDRRYKSSLISNMCRMYMLSEETTSEKEYIPYNPVELELDASSLSNSPALFIPWTLVHYITPDSPLFNVSRDDLAKKKAEIVLVMEGTVQEVGLTLQLRTNYTPEEILFHHRFTNIIHRHAEGGCWVDWAMFDQVEPDGSKEVAGLATGRTIVPPVVLKVPNKRKGRARAESAVEHPNAFLSSFLNLRSTFSRSRRPGSAASMDGNTHEGAGVAPAMGSPGTVRRARAHAQSESRPRPATEDLHRSEEDDDVRTAPKGEFNKRSYKVGFSSV